MNSNPGLVSSRAVIRNVSALSDSECRDVLERADHLNEIVEVAILRKTLPAYPAEILLNLLGSLELGKLVHSKREPDTPCRYSISIDAIKADLQTRGTMLEG